MGALLPTDRLIQSVLISVERTPKLLECSRDSIMRTAMSAACLALPIDGVTGQSFMIPFAGKAQLIIGYKGYNSLAARADLTVSGEVIREGDDIDYDIGEGWVRHKPDLLAGPNRRIVGAWAKAAHLHRPPIVAVLPIDEILQIKQRAPGARKSDSPWNDSNGPGYAAMCAKTAKRRLARSIPMAPGPSAQYHWAARMDEAHEEQGLHAYVMPERGVEIEGEAQRIGTWEPSETPTAQTLTEDPEVTKQRAALEDIALNQGTDSLKTAWAAISRTRLAEVLKPELDRLKKLAAETDADQTR